MRFIHFEGSDVMTRRARLSVVGLGTAVVLVAVAALGYRWMTTSHPVTAAAAVRAYRAQHHDTTLTTPAPTAHPATARHPATVASARNASAAIRRDAPAADPLAW